jgi:hypothetical protein
VSQRHARRPAGTCVLPQPANLNRSSVDPG